MADVAEASTYDLRKIIRKLGHDLHEVRLRSLENVLSKLHNGIISHEDLIHIRELYIHLLEWLKQPSKDDKYTQDILKLLSSLSEYSAGGTTLIDLSGVEFFSLYRQNVSCDQSVIEYIDNILNNLFLVHNEVDTGDVVAQTVNINESTTCSDVNEYSIEKSAEILLKYNALKENQHSTSQSVLTNTVIIEDCNVENVEPIVQDQDKVCIDTPCADKNSKDKVNRLYQSFQWIPLTSGDRQILSVTDNRLQSCSPDLIVQSCQFLRCVLFHDFPAEVFIQRPNIFNTLLSIINTYEGKNVEIVKHVLECLTDLTRNLHKRLLQNQNKDLWLPPSQNSDEYETTLMTECFMQEQCSLTDFSLKSLLSTVNLIKLYFKENHLFSEVVILHASVMRLLYSDDFKSYWCNNVSGNKMVYNLLTLLHKFDDVISNLPVQNTPKFVLEGQAYDLKSIIISRLLTKLILTTVPGDRVYEAVTDRIVTFLEKVICNVSFLSHLDRLRKGLEKILKNADEKFYSKYSKALRIIKSMKCIDQWQNYMAGNEEKVNEDDMLIIWRQVLPSLSYHCHKGFIWTSVQFCCEKYSSVKEKRPRWSEMLMSLVQYSGTCVITEVYTSILELMKVAFSDTLVTDPLSIKHQVAELLVHKDVLTEIIYQGITHKNERVCSITKSIISTLLLSRLNMSSEMWKTVLRNFTPLLPSLLGVLGGADAAYNKSLLSLVEHPYTILDVDGRNSGLTEVEQIRLLMRLFFARAEKVRSKAFPLILLHLINRNKEQKIIRKYPSVSNFSAGDLFVFSLQRLAVLVANTSCFEDISNDNIQKLWDVLTDRSVNGELRHSAAEQLAILTRDSLLQSTIVHNESYCFLTGEISKLVIDGDPEKTTTMSKYTLSLLKILKNLLGNHSSLRHILALQSNLYLDLLEVAIVFVKHEEICYEISCVLVYLLFCDIFNHPESMKDKGKLVLPQDICHNFRFPIEFSYSSKRITSTDEELLPSGDLLWDFIKQSCWVECKWFKVDDLQSKCNKLIHVLPDEKVLYENNITQLILCIGKGLSAPAHHFSAIAHIGHLQLLLLLCDRSDDERKFCKEVASFLDDLISNGFIKNIMSKSPSSKEDCELFKAVLFFMSMVIDLGVKQLINNFDVLVLSGSVASIIGEQPDRKHPNGKSDLLVKQSLISLVTSTLEYKSPSHLSSGLLDADKETGISSLVVAMYQNLSVGGSESYYNLPLLEVMLECFVHLLVHRKWSLSSNKSLCRQLLHWSSQIVVSFHFDRATAGVSFMGKGIVKKAIICLCHMVREISLVEKDAMSWKLLLNIDANDSKSEQGSAVHRLSWLVPLLSDRLIDIRWGALALSSALISEMSGEEIIVNEYQSLPGGIWAASIRIILDVKECFMVRRQACILLTNLIKSGTCKLKKNASVWTQMIVQDTDSQVKVSGVDAFFMLLDHLDFFLQFRNLFSSESSSSIATSSIQASASSFPYDSSEEESQFTNVSEDINMFRGDSYSSVKISQSTTNPTTKNIVKSYSLEVSRAKTDSISYKSSLLHLLSNLISLIPDVVIKKLKELQLLPTIFNVWSPLLLLKSAHTISRGDECRLAYQEFAEQVKFTLSLLQLFSVVHEHNQEYCYQLLQKNKIIPKVLALFNLCTHSSPDNLPFYIPIWKEAVSIIEMLLLHDVDNIQGAHDELANHLQYICGSLLSLAQHVKNDMILKKFINVIFLILKSDVTPANEEITFTHPLDSLYFEEDLITLLKKNKHIVDYLEHDCLSVGEVLCVLLIYIKTKLGASQTSSFVVSTLAHLFIRSKKAKIIAYKNGLVETVIEEVKDILIRMNVSSLTESKSMGKKKILLIRELCCFLTLVRDFCTFSKEIKDSFVDNHLLSHVQNVWGWSSTDRMLRRCLLQLLVALSNDCENAQISMCSTIVVSTLSEEVSLLHHVIKLLITLHNESSTGKFNVCLPLCFDILANLSNQSQCRHIIIKSNLFNWFVNAHSITYSAKKLQRNTGRKLVNEWVKLTSVMTFHCDAAKTVGKVTSCFEILLEMIKNGNALKKERSLMTLRNLMFVPVYKQTISSDEVMLENVLAQLDHKSIKIKLLVVSFFWVALYENQKAKVFLKKKNLRNQLKNIEVSDGSTETWYEDNLESTVAKVQLLLKNMDV